MIRTEKEKTAMRSGPGSPVFKSLWLSRAGAALFLIGGIIPAAASAATIDFSSLAQPGASYASAGTSYTTQGFTFTDGGSTLASWQESSPNLPGLAAADTSLFAFYSGVQVNLTDAGNAPFTLNSIDLAPLLAGGSGPFDVAFIGTRADNSTVSATFVVNDSTPAALQTFNFANFSNVVGVSFTQGYNSGFYGSQGTAYQFDNIVVSTASSGAPEPSTMALMGLGAVLVGCAGRRRKSASN